MSFIQPHSTRQANIVPNSLDRNTLNPGARRIEGAIPTGRLVRFARNENNEAGCCARRSGGEPVVIFPADPRSAPQDRTAEEGRVVMQKRTHSWAFLRVWWISILGLGAGPDVAGKETQVTGGCVCAMVLAPDTVICRVRTGEPVERTGPVC